MPRIPNTLRVEGIYYLRKRVPADVEKVLNKTEIRVSLRTSDYKIAARKVPYEMAKLESKFEEARKRKALLAPPLETITELSDAEAMQLVASWFIGLEKDSEQWWQDEGQFLPSEKSQDVMENIATDAAALQGGSQQIAEDDGSIALDAFLKSRNLPIKRQSPAYRRLQLLFRRGLLENTLRGLDRLSRRTVTPHDSFFRDLFGFSQLPKHDKVSTLDDLINAFTEHHKQHSSAGTQRTYQIPIRLLLEFFGKRKRITDIKPPEMKAFFDLLEQAPKNAVQRYPGLSLRSAIAAADKKGDTQRLSPKTLANYYTNVVAIFNFAVEMQMADANPANNRLFRDRFNLEDDDEPKALFTVEELNKLFRSPLYTGSEDDEAGYARKGPNIVKRGRFWIPLLSLFHGFRANEVCQLYTQDVKEEDGTWFIWVRENLDDGTKADKKLKNRMSKRRVPIHEELIRMGFLAFVESRRADANSPRLFPELPVGSHGYYSEQFSKWFGRFTERFLPASKATFHSFRHLWRTSLLHADVGVADVEALGGWESERRSSEKHYSHGQLLRKLKTQIDKVQFPGLNLSHLHKPVQARIRQRVHPQ